MNSYFPHDSNARNDAKILKVRMKYGAEGYGVYFMLLERLRDDSEYMSVKDYNMIAFDLRVDASLIKDIVENFGLFAFADNGECFYSESFNKRMLIKDEVSNKRAAAGKKGAAKRWNGKAIAKPSSENSKDIAKPQEDDGNKSKVKESKVNKNKIDSQAGVRVHENARLLWQNVWGFPNAIATQDLEEWIGNFGDDLVCWVIKYAARKDVKAKGADRYLAKVFDGYTERKIKTVEQAEAESKKHEETARANYTGPQRYGKPERVDKEPDWLKPGYQEPKHEVTPEQRAKLAEQLEKLNKLGEKN
ncbi:primosome subunit DnaD [Lacticaseibacillus paracasei subsp. paracasei Lpp125]|uniref:Lin1244/Lin1753 domain-containing protein n=1 Tax=Lacticaseibacillus paracasei TaxID=1597 RepID=UPI0003434A06|nr:Lin1244/Lin1753 domain-containing protein [Lacticaseibacillus paracasei]EPD02473.1 primosome subunit DnaD [Lacticaseibacillus paracasei subsp. paracasei Lpp125]